MSIISDIRTKLDMALDRSLPTEAQAFAVCECVAAQHLGALAGGLLLLARF